MGTVYAVNRRGRGKEEKQEEKFSVELVERRAMVKESLASVEAPREETLSEPSKERIITERVLVICSYCGSKTEQGITKCQKCGADL